MIIHVTRIDFEHKKYKRSFKADFYCVQTDIPKIRLEYLKRFDKSDGKYTRLMAFEYNEVKKLKLKKI